MLTRLTCGNRGKLHLPCFQHLSCFQSLLVEYFGILDGLDFMLEEKHWNRGAIKCLDILMEGMVDY